MARVFVAVSIVVTTWLIVSLLSGAHISKAEADAYWDAWAYKWCTTASDAGGGLGLDECAWTLPPVNFDMPVEAYAE